MKTRYTIEFDNYEILMSKVITISKQEALENIKKLDRIVEETREEEIPMTKRVVIQEGETVQAVKTMYLVAGATTIITMWTCKEGFKFKNKKESR